MKQYLSIAASKRLIAIVAKYKDSTPAPHVGRWKEMDDADLFLAVLVQIAVVGSAASGDALKKVLLARKEWYRALTESTAHTRLKELHRVFASAGVRYVSADVDACKKTAASAFNLDVIEGYGGPKNYFKDVAEIPHESWRVAAVSDDLAYVKNKGARDLLIGLGIVESAIAFDTRLLSILAHVGVKLPPEIRSNRRLYKAMELELIEKVCGPSGVSGAHLDRILFANQRGILA